MNEIEFARDYGYHPPAPFWLVYAEETPTVNRVVQTEHSREAAEAAAARMALAFPGHEFYVCCVMTGVQTSPKVVGRRFDPTKILLPEPESPEFAEVDEAPNAPAIADEPL